MIVFWTACLASIIFTWAATHTDFNIQKSNVSYWLIVTFISAFPLIFVAAVRYKVGADYTSYYNYYISLVNGGSRGRYEILYYLMNEVVAIFHLPSPWMFGLAASLFLMPVYKRVIDDSPYPSMSIFLLLGMTYYFYFLNGMRQMIGAAFLLLSTQYIYKRKIVPFTILVLIATGFHNTSAVFFAFYFLCWMDLSPQMLTKITIGIFLFGQVLGNLANKILGSMSYYSVYLQTNYASQGQGYVVLAMNILLTVFATFFYRDGNEKFKLYYNMQVMALWAAALTGKVILVDRFRMVFGLASIILVPLTIEGIENIDTKRLCAAGMVAVYFLYVTYTIGIQNGNSILPYQTVF